MSNPINLLVFGDFSIDLRQRILLNKGRHVSLAPKAFEVLLVLIENRDRIVSKEELMERVWPDAFVEEINVAKNISLLRKILASGNGENGNGKAEGENGQYIVTVSKRGYRFVHEVQETAVNPPIVIRQMPQVRAAAPPQSTVPSAVIDTSAENAVSSLPELITPAPQVLPTQKSFAVRRWPYLVGLAVAVIVIISIGFAFHQGSNQFNPTKIKNKVVASWNDSVGADLFQLNASADSKFVAYSKSEGGQANIYVQQMVDNESRPITKDESPEYNPIWSPDGRHIAYLSARGGYKEIWITSLFAGTGEKVFSFNHDYMRLLSWSKDGTKIFYSTVHEVWVLDLGSRQTKSVMNFGGTNSIKHDFSLSPDEKFIAYVETINKSARIFIVSLDGGEPRQITKESDQNVSPIWLADSKRILYSSNQGNSYQLCIAYLDGRPPTQLISNYENTVPLHASADGRSIFYQLQREEADVYHLNLETGRETQITSDAFLEVLPELSLDGKTIALQHADNGGPILQGSILLRHSEAKSATIKRIEKGYDARRSPKSEYLAFLRDAGGISNLWVMKNGGAEQQLTQTALAVNGISTNPYDWAQPYNYTWSPTEDLLTFSAKIPDVFNIWGFSADGSVKTKLSNNNDPTMKLFCPMWSSDGNRLAYLAQPTATGRASRKVLMHERGADSASEQTLFQTDWRIRMVGWSESGTDFLVGLVVPEESGPIVNLDLRRIIPGQVGARLISQLSGVYFNSPRLSPDGKLVAFVSRQNNCDNIWQVSLDDRRLKQLTSNTNSQLRLAGLAWAPDRKGIYFSKQSTTTTIWAMENFD